jgi:hypothetical protein
MNSGASIVVHNAATLKRSRSNKVSKSCMMRVKVIVMNHFEALVSESVVCFCNVITMSDIDETHVGNRGGWGARRGSRTRKRV